MLMDLQALDRLSGDIRSQIADPYLKLLFDNCLRNTVETTVEQYQADGRDYTFVITGDIPAMWLRDSTAQVWPYLRLADDPQWAAMLRGVVNQQAALVLRDPYANAFLRDASAWYDGADITDMRAGVHERKWEPDSLAYVMRLAHGYWQATGDVSAFDAQWLAAMRLALATLRREQRWDDNSGYRFQRLTTNPIDTLGNDGWGWPAKPNGMVASGFRSSDDACVYPFNIPTQHLLVGALTGLAEVASAVGAIEIADESTSLAGDIAAALEVVKHQYECWPFEVDGFGNALFVDDPNIPSLLSLPYLEACRKDDDYYLATRRRILSDDNPYFYRGKLLQGIGSPHTGSGKVWPMAIIMQALTATDDEEIEDCLGMCIASTGGRGLMNESVSVSDASDFTRGWFAWCNSLFAELIMQLAADRPRLLQRDYRNAAGGNL